MQADRPMTSRPRVRINLHNARLLQVLIFTLSLGSIISKSRMRVDEGKQSAWPQIFWSVQVPPIACSCSKLQRVAGMTCRGVAKKRLDVEVKREKKTEH
ncbi:hypothetical protein K1719_044982 [Acacia pycnantha]|nr:hypothetical protein K1719_044982 [Acacia pycnantha]